MAWNFVQRLSTPILRATSQQSATDAGLIYVAPTYTVPGASPVGGVVGEGLQLKMNGLAIRRFDLFNSVAATLTVGIGFRLHNRYWRVGITDGTTFTEDTTDAQNLTASDVIIGADGATGNTTEFVILATVPFNWFSMNIGTAEVDAAAAVDHVVQYSNAAGTGWTTYAGAYLDNFTLTNAILDAGAREFLWIPPAGLWGKTVSLGGLPNGYYAMRIETADLGAGDTAALASAIEVGTMVVKEAILTNTSWNSGDIQLQSHEADAVVAFFSTADALNRVQCEVTTF